jgi:hypothetical protein
MLDFAKQGTCRPQQVWSNCDEEVSIGNLIKGDQRPHFKPIVAKATRMFLLKPSKGWRLARSDNNCKPTSE